MATILVIDDDADMRNLVRAFLLAEGHTIETADNGKVAMRVAPDLLPDLIISDILMPGLDGFGLFEAIRAHPKTAKIPVIFLTASNDRETLLRALRMGVDDYVSKPFDQAELVSVVTQRLRPSAGTDAQSDPWTLEMPVSGIRLQPVGRKKAISEFVPKEAREKPAPEPAVPKAADVAAWQKAPDSAKPSTTGPASTAPAWKPTAPAESSAPTATAKPGIARPRPAPSPLVTIANDDAPIRFSMSDTALANIDAATERREATATLLFCDVRGFQKFREGLNGMQVVEILTQFFLSSRNTVTKQGGWLVKFLGDGFVAAFEDSTGQAESQQVRALKAALMIVLAAQRLKSWLRTRFPERAFPEFAIGIGLHTGPVTIGKLPDSFVERYTVAGEPVALCLRLEQMTKELGWSIVASQATFLSAAEILSLGRGAMAPKVGQTANLLVAEVRGPLPDAAATQEQQKVFSLIDAAVESNTAAIVAYSQLSPAAPPPPK